MEKKEMDLEEVVSTTIESDAETPKMTDEEIDTVVKAATESTPEEVINMNKSIENTDSNGINEDDYAPEIRDINLDSSYADILSGLTKEDADSITKDLFDIAEGNSCKLSDEDVEARMKENAGTMFDLPEDQIVQFMQAVNTYKKNKSINAFDILPSKVKQMIVTLYATEGLSEISGGGSVSVMHNKMAKLFLDEFISEAELDETFVDLERSLDEALKMPSIVDLYSEHTREVMEVKIPEVVEKFKDTEPKRAKLLLDIKDQFTRSYSLIELKEHFDNNARTRKLMRRDYKNWDRFCDEFNLKNDKSKFKMSDCRSIYIALIKVLLDEPERAERATELSINEIDVSKFVVLFCRTSMNRNPSDIIDASFMYYSLKNITMLNLTNEAKTEFAEELINNICDVMVYVREKEEEFYASNQSSIREPK